MNHRVVDAGGRVLGEAPSREEAIADARRRSRLGMSVAVQQRSWVSREETYWFTIWRPS